jgi:8-oxo-dGTP pyrophosphatase MutT (NUDIX family)
MTAPTFPGYWGFPGGLVDFGETPQQAGIREAQEEIGVEFYAEENPFWEGGVFDRKLSYFLSKWRVPAALQMQQDEVGGCGWFTLPDALNLPLSFRYREVIEHLITII